MEKFTLKKGTYIENVNNYQHKDQYNFRQRSIISANFMSELCNLFGIKNKTVFCYGSSLGPDEIHFSKNGNDIILNDIDEMGEIRQFLNNHHENGGEITFLLGDAFKVDIDPVDVVFSSGFAPDEYYKHDLAYQQEPRIIRIIRTRLARYISYEWVCKTILGYKHQWNPESSPFMPGFIEKTREILKPGGLFIVQSWAGHVSGYDENYIHALQNQLSDMDFSLLAIYPVKKTPFRHLIVACRNPVPIIPGDLQAGLSEVHPRIKIDGGDSTAGVSFVATDLPDSNSPPATMRTTTLVSH